MILGGAGGLGNVTTKYLVEKYKAQIIWLGRRPLDKTIRKLQDEIEALGIRPEYIQCDANQSSSMQAAYSQVKTRYKEIHGLFHSAIVLNDMLLKNMSGEDFRSAFDIKSLASHHFIEAFKEEPLDLICFYSSIQSHWNAPGQANYSAGCTYKDSYSYSLAQSLHIPICTINWGYWGEVGVVSSDDYREQMAAQGIGSITAVEGMEILEKMLSGDEKQLSAVKLSQAAVSHLEFISTAKEADHVKQVSKLLLPSSPAVMDYKIDRDAEKALEELCLKGLIVNLMEMGFGEIHRESLSVQQLGRALGITKDYHKLFSELIQALEQTGYLENKDNTFEISDAARKKLTDFHIDKALAKLKTQKHRLRCTLQADRHLSGIVKIHSERRNKSH